MPAQRWLTETPARPIRSAMKRSSARLHGGRRPIRVGVLGLEVGPPAAADRQAPVAGRTRVDKAVVGVRRQRDHRVGDRLGREHLPAHRVDDARELGHEPGQEPVAGDDDGGRGGGPRRAAHTPDARPPLDRLHGRALVQHGARGGGSSGERSHPAGGLQLAVAREHRRVRVVRRASAPAPAPAPRGSRPRPPRARPARPSSHRPPRPRRATGCRCGARRRARRGRRRAPACRPAPPRSPAAARPPPACRSAPPQSPSPKPGPGRGEAAVSAARAGGRPPRLEHGHRCAGLGQRQCAGAAGHARADHHDVRPDVACERREPRRTVLHLPQRARSRHGAQSPSSLRLAAVNSSAVSTPVRCSSASRAT